MTKKKKISSEEKGLWKEHIRNLNSDAIRIVYLKYLFNACPLRKDIRDNEKEQRKHIVHTLYRLSRGNSSYAVTGARGRLLTMVCRFSANEQNKFIEFSANIQHSLKGLKSNCDEKNDSKRRRMDKLDAELNRISARLRRKRQLKRKLKEEMNSRLQEYYRAIFRAQMRSVVEMFGGPITLEVPIAFEVLREYLQSYHYNSEFRINVKEELGILKNNFQKEKSND